MKLWRLEAMRGVAAAWVLVAHGIDHLGNTDALHFGNWRGLPIYGSVGVNFFFVLSGFVMIVSHPGGIGRTREVGRFLWRRFCRIYPFFWLMLAYAAWLYGTGTWRDLIAWASLLPIRLDYLLIPAWTLQQEVCFYLLFAVCLLPRIGRWALAAWVVAVILLNNPWPIGWPGGIWGVITWRGLNVYTYLFFAGMLAGIVLPRVRAERATGVTLCLLGAAVVVGRLAFDGWGRVDGPTYAYVLYGSVSAASFSASRRWTGRVRPGRARTEGGQGGRGGFVSAVSEPLADDRDARVVPGAVGRGGAHRRVRLLRRARRGVAARRGDAGVRGGSAGAEIAEARAARAGASAAVRRAAARRGVTRSIGPRRDSLGRTAGRAGRMVDLRARLRRDDRLGVKGDAEAGFAQHREVVGAVADGQRGRERDRVRRRQFAQGAPAWRRGRGSARRPRR